MMIIDSVYTDFVEVLKGFFEVCPDYILHYHASTLDLGLESLQINPGQSSES